MGSHEEEVGVKVGLLGPEGVRQRMQELQAKIDAANGDTFKNTLNATLDAAPPSGSAPFSGLIGNLPGPGGGTSPLNPMGPGFSISGGQSAPADIKAMITQAAQEAGIDEHLLDAVVQAESSYNPTARSRAGAVGLAQLMPDTAKSLGVTNLTDPLQSVRGGAKYLAQLLSRFGDMRLAIAGYNAGPNAVEKAGGIPNYPETRAYVDRVMKLYKDKGGGS